jgi:hypothetical protein
MTCQSFNKYLLLENTDDDSGGVLVKLQCSGYMDVTRSRSISETPAVVGRAFHGSDFPSYLKKFVYCHEIKKN